MEKLTERRFKRRQQLIEWKVKMNVENIKQSILSKFREKEIMKDLTEDEDFFDLGVSSLTIVELQIVIEKELKLAVATSTLMGSPTVKEWVDVYTQKAKEQSLLESDVVVS